MIVEVHGSPVWTRVRFPPGPCVVMRRGPPQVGGVLMTNCGKEGPIEDGRIPYHAGRRPRTKFVYYSVCYFCIRRKEAIGFFDGIEQAKKWLLDERRDLV